MARPIINAKMVGAETVVTDLRRHGETIRARLRAEVAAAAAELAGRAAQLAPKRTGALAASIKAVGFESETKLLASVGTDIKHGMAFYGRFQESGWTPNPRKSGQEWKRNPRKEREWKAYIAKHGTRKIYANPFLKPALAQLRGRIRDRMLAAVRGAG